MRWIALAVAVMAAPTAWAGPPPQPPCAGDVVPPWPAPGTGPSVTVWHTDALPEQWQPAACSGLAPPAGATFVAVAGRFRHEGTALDVLARLGTISRQLGMLYWNVSDLDWRRLLVDASALSGPDPAQRRPDFQPAELAAGSHIYALYDDDQNPGPVVFETEIREADPDGFVIVARNVTDLRLMGISIAAPGDLSSMTAVRRTGSDTFDYYSLSAMALNPLAAAMMSDSDQVNRAVATFRYLAGIAGDRDPPVALK
ncbi:MAG: DUF6675 family protein [Geminicoccaceae bacterium]